MGFQIRDASIVPIEKVPHRIKMIEAAVELTMPEGLQLLSREVYLRSAQFGMEYCYAIRTEWKSRYYEDVLAVTTWGEAPGKAFQVDFHTGMFGAENSFNGHVAEDPFDPSVHAAFIEDVADALLAEHGMFKTLNWRPM